ncbi:MAG TPA: DUF721 domain-containing protein [Ilumatobacteraceae bacterium]|nr:DUF721 domain-containing protein [Ilumatobacteraceae bacterium]
MRSKDEPVRLGDSLHGVVRSLRPEASGPTASALGGVFGKWEVAVGPAVAAHVRPLKLEGTTLVVQADDPAWATQLKFLEASLRDRLREVTGAVIEKLEVRVGARRA